MKTSRVILSAASVIPLLSSCSSQQQVADNQLWNIKPVYNVRHATETPGGYYQLGRYYQGQRRYEQALAAYRKALALDASFAEARNGMGVVYSMQGRNRESIEQFRLAAEMAPNAVHIQNNLGYALYLNKSYAEAVVVLDKAVSLDPSNQSANTNLALALDKTGDKDRAVQVLAQAAGQQAAEEIPQATGESQPVQTAAAPAPAVVTVAIPTPAPQTAALSPKIRGVAAEAATRPVSKAEVPAQAAQVTSKVPEVRAQSVAVQAVAADKPTSKTAVPMPAKQQVTVAAQAAPKPAMQTRGGGILTVEMEPKSYEARAQADVHVQATDKPLQQAALQRKGQDVPAAQAVLKLASSPELHLRNVPQQPSAGAVVRQVQAAGPVAVSYRIEVSNGNGVAGMARKVAGFLQKEGDPRARLTNQKPFQVATSQVQYRSGYREQAQSLASALPGRPGIAQSGDLRGDVSVRVLLGKDIASNVAYFEQGKEKVRIASIEAAPGKSVR